MKARTRTVVLLTAAIGAVSAATAEALPVGSPKSLRPARAADAFLRGAEMERWSVDFVNPRTRAHFNVTISQRGQLAGRFAHSDVFDSTWLPFPRDEIGPMVGPTTRDRLEWRGRDLVALTRRGRRWRVRVED